MDIVKGKRNQLANARNPYQGPQDKVLCLCSAGLLRSATIADILVKSGKYNVRNAGCSQEYALIPLSEALLYWCDTIVVVEEWREYIEDALKAYGHERKVVSLDIPDEYSRNDPVLVEIIKQGLYQVGML